MDNEIVEIENVMKKLTDSEFGEKHSIVLSLSELEEIPIQSFRQLQELLFSGEAIVRQYPGSIQGGTFDFFSTKTENRLFVMFSFLNFVLPLIGIILGIFYYSWFLLFLLSPIFTFRLGLRIYLHALFDRAGKSEIAFCFLFCSRSITIELPGQEIIFRA